MSVENSFRRFSMAGFFLILGLALGVENGGAEPQLSQLSNDAPPSEIRTVEPGASVDNAQDIPHYYFVGAFLAHPYVRDIKLGFNYAQIKLNVRISTLGPQGPDFQAQAEAMTEAIDAKPDGIIIPLWGSAAVPHIKEARRQGIPVVAIEAAPAEHGANTYIGLDNYRAGLLTAKELIRKGGRKGKLALVLNIASNTDLKKQGVLDGLKDTEWEIVAEVNDKTNTDDATRGSIMLLRDHPELTGIIGLNSSSGAGIGNAIGQLGLIQ